MKRRFYVLLLLPLAILSCQLVGESPEPFTITSKGVGALRFGMTEAEALKHVGDRTGGAWSDGLRSWTSQEYRIGPSGTINLFFLNDDAFPEPLLDFFSMPADFPGTTTLGVGIGSTKAEVDRFYRTPEGKMAASSSTWVGPYCLDDKDMYFLFEDGQVARMSIGYYWIKDTDFFGRCAVANRE